MKKGKEKGIFSYIPEDPIKVLKNYTEKESLKEVLYTLGEQEIIKEDGKFYLCHTVYPDLSKTISRETATEILQDYGLKSRTDIDIL